MLPTNNLPTREDVVKFVKDVQEEFNKDNKFEGVYILYMGDDYSLVMTIGMDEEDNTKYTLFGKIAYNCDDLQCDYDWDWYMPYTDDGDVYPTEIDRCEGYDAEKLADDFIDIFDGVHTYAHIPTKEDK